MSGGRFSENPIILFAPDDGGSGGFDPAQNRSQELSEAEIEKYVSQISDLEAVPLRSSLANLGEQQQMVILDFIVSGLKQMDKDNENAESKRADLEWFGECTQFESVGLAVVAILKELGDGFNLKLLANGTKFKSVGLAVVTALQELNMLDELQYLARFANTESVEQAAQTALGVLQVAQGEAQHTIEQGIERERARADGQRRETETYILELRGRSDYRGIYEVLISTFYADLAEQYLDLLIEQAIKEKDYRWVKLTACHAQSQVIAQRALDLLVEYRNDDKHYSNFLMVAKDSKHQAVAERALEVWIEGRSGDIPYPSAELARVVIEAEFEAIALRIVELFFQLELTRYSDFYYVYISDIARKCRHERVASLALDLLIINGASLQKVRDRSTYWYTQTRAGQFMELRRAQRTFPDDAIKVTETQVTSGVNHLDQNLPVKLRLAPEQQTEKEDLYKLIYWSYWTEANALISRSSAEAMDVVINQLVHSRNWTQLKLLARNVESERVGEKLVDVFKSNNRWLDLSYIASFSQVEQVGLRAVKALVDAGQWQVLSLVPSFSNITNVGLVVIQAYREEFDRVKEMIDRSEAKSIQAHVIHVEKTARNQVVKRRANNLVGFTYISDP